MRSRLSIAPLIVTALLCAAIATSIGLAPRDACAQAPSGTLTVAVATFGNERWLPHLYVGAEDVVLKPMYENLLTRDPKTGDLAPMHDKAMQAPLFEPAFLNGYGPRVAESGLGLITYHGYSAPYEDVKLKAR